MSWAGFYVTVLAVGGAIAILAILVRGARRRRGAKGGPADGA